MLQPTPVDVWASEAHVRVEHVANVRDSAAIERIIAVGAEAALLADFGQIIPGALLNQYSRGIVNLHPSLLPRHRGASPIPATILAGDPETGVTTIVMDQGVDTGPIIAVQHMRPSPLLTAAELELELADLAAAGVADTLATWVRGSEAARPQPAAGATLTARLTRADGQIRSTTPIEIALRMWRAYQPWPGVWIACPGLTERLILSSVRAAEVREPVDPGRLEVRDGGLLLGLPGGALHLEQVIPAGGTAMSGVEFARGRTAELAAHGRISE